MGLQQSQCSFMVTQCVAESYYIIVSILQLFLNFDLTLHESMKAEEELTW